MFCYGNPKRGNVVEMRLKRSKKPHKGFANVIRVYDADTDEIRSIWLKHPSTLKCPILGTCMECGRCIPK